MKAKLLRSVTQHERLKTSFTKKPILPFLNKNGGCFLLDETLHKVENLTAPLLKGSPHCLAQHSFQQLLTVQNPEVPPWANLGNDVDVSNQGTGFNPAWHLREPQRGPFKTSLFFSQNRRDRKLAWSQASEPFMCSNHLGTLFKCRY